ncbi:glycosyltransferase family 4 protein [Sunxiuqinia sp. A32]|uniref:glycosyltransferase family 4 protein n=1 Tax=Sunxiuqinia sp. A32 TaxID=3461496 RepID=UPI0040452A6A
MIKKLSIGFDAKRAFVNAAGLGNYSRNTLKSLAEFYPQNQYVFFTPKVDHNRFLLPQSSVVVLPNNFWWRALKPFWRTYKISELAEKAKLDIYHGLSHELPIGIQKTGIKSVVTIHDLIFVRFPELYKATDRKIYYKKFNHACKIADRIIAISEQSKNDIIDYFDIDPCKIRVVYQAVNPIFYQRNELEQLKVTKEKYGLPDEFMLTVGTIEARKNLRTTLEAMNSGDIKLPLVVVGKPTKYLETIKPFVHKLGDQLILLHQVNDLDLSRIYRMAKLMIYVSIFEGFGLPIAEAQASGCPVITSGVSSMPEAGGDAARYVSPNSISEIAYSIKLLLEDESYRKDLINKGFENAKRFTYETYSSNLMEVYKELCDE